MYFGKDVKAAGSNVSSPGAAEAVGHEEKLTRRAIRRFRLSARAD